MSSHYIYILGCSDGSLYTGYTTDISERVKTHNGETTKEGAKYTRGRRPVRVLYSERLASRSDALSREAAIKKLSKAQKLRLIGDAL